MSVPADLAPYMGKLDNKDIIHEGFLRVRAEQGIAGLRPWLLRYFVLCKDFTLRRFHQSEEVDKPNAKTLKVYQISEFEAVVPDVPPRFFSSSQVKVG